MMLRSVLQALLRSTLEGSTHAWIFASKVNFVTLIHIKSQKSAMTGLQRIGMKQRKSILNGSETLLSIYAGFDILAMIDGALHSIHTAMRNMNYPCILMASSSEN
jgi:hypothetical protein